MPQPQPLSITINVARGSVTCSPDSAEASRGQRVEWNCSGGPWAVLFGARTPFAESGFNGGRGQANGGPVQPNATAGRYKYFVAAYDGTNVVAADPDIIIR